MSKPKICLLMNVGNEENFILPALESVRPYIHGALIVWSGDDGTADLINQCLGDSILVHIIKHPFTNGRDQRSFVMQQFWERKGLGYDYALYIDADNVLQVTSHEVIIGQDDKPTTLYDNPFLNLTLDAYWIRKQMGEWQYDGVVQVLKASIEWEFESVIHEYPVRKDREPFSTGAIHGAIVHEAMKGPGTDRPRDLARHYYDHALILENELFYKDPPQHLVHRYWFYLANSYYDAGMMDRAKAAYEKRIELGGWYEEVYYSYYRIATITGNVIDYWTAWNYRPQRLEAAYELMGIYANAGQWHTALVVGLYSANFLPIKDQLLLNSALYEGTRFTDLLRQVKEARTITG